MVMAIVYSDISFEYDKDVDAGYIYLGDEIKKGKVKKNHRT